jgi:hypothetical protein
MGNPYSEDPRWLSSGARQQLRAIGFYIAVAGVGLIAWGGWKVIDALMFADRAHREVITDHRGVQTAIMLDRVTGELREGRTAQLVVPYGTVVGLGFGVFWMGYEVIMRNRGPRGRPRHGWNL